MNAAQKKMNEYIEGIIRNSMSNPFLFPTNSEKGLGEDLLTVESMDNHVYFYSEITSDRSLALIRKIRDIDSSLRTEKINRNMPEDYFTPIWLHIQSPGGDLFAGLALADQLSRVKSPIHSIVEGFAASAATLVSMSCSKRFIQPSAFILMHQLGGANFGAYDELQDKMHLLDMMMEVVTEFYVNKTGLEKEVIKNILSRDSWFSAKESLELGLVDEIL